MAGDVIGGSVLRTMPLCKYPEQAHYNGTGDKNNATSWSCSPLDRSLLDVRLNGIEAGLLGHPDREASGDDSHQQRMIGGAQSTLILTELNSLGQQTTVPDERPIPQRGSRRWGCLEQGGDLAKYLGESNLVLMRDHGFAPPAHMYLLQGEIDARTRGYRPYSTETWRAWEYWANKAGCGHMLTRPDNEGTRALGS